MLIWPNVSAEKCSAAGVTFWWTVAFAAFGLLPALLLPSRR
jgi:hypothetical protein